MSQKQLEVGDVFADQDVARFGRQYKVLMIVRRPELVREDTAVCLTRGKVTSVAVRRLLHPSRFALIPQPTATEAI